ncbi:MAG: stealth family protein [Nocardioides sp.]
MGEVFVVSGAFQPARVVRGFALIAAQLPNWRMEFVDVGKQAGRIRAVARKTGVLDRVAVRDSAPREGQLNGPGGPTQRPGRGNSTLRAGVFGWPVEAIASELLSLAAAGGPVSLVLVEAPGVVTVEIATARPAAETTPAMARAELLQRALAAADSAVAFVVPARGDAPPIVVVPAESGAPVLFQFGVADAAGVLLTPPRAADSPDHLSAGADVRLELWPRGLDGTLLAPSVNHVTRKVPTGERLVDSVVSGLPVETLPLLATPAPDASRFEIDVVYTWVDGEDPEWLARRAPRLGVTSDERSAGEARYRSRDELRYSMRSVHLFAPWVRRIHLVTDQQVPSWLAADERVNVVDHRDILDESVLPTFNSHAIETALHRIEGLSEHFVYFNDDVLLGRPVTPDLFFSPGGLPAAYVSHLTLDLEGSDDRPYAMAAFHNRRLLLERFGVAITHTMRHTPHPHRRSTLELIEAEFPDAIARTAAAPFRATTDVSLLSSLAQHYGLLSGLAVVGDAVDEFVDLSEANVKPRLAALRARDFDFLCLGDHHAYALPIERVDEMLADFLTAYYPVRAPWERA